MVMISVVELFDINDKCCWPKEAFVERKQEVGRQHIISIQPKIVTMKAKEV